MPKSGRRAAAGVLAPSVNHIDDMLAPDAATLSACPPVISFRGLYHNTIISLICVSAANMISPVFTCPRYRCLAHTMGGLIPCMSL